ncbi:MAG TPA: PLP-dependent aminotransferase family protein [Bauldia sp.]|nr:PLP-dependent aminotransferase family protein [Bauldia sp.]
MTRWRPDLGGGTGDAYARLADAIEQGIRAGRLKAGERLPTHRELSRRLGIAVSTVTRGYAEAARRGLIASTVGRGTFVNVPPGGLPVAANGEETRPLERMYVSLVARASATDLSLNHPLGDGVGAALAAGLDTMIEARELDRLAIYQPPQGMAEHREAGAMWLDFLGVEADPDSVMVIAGGQTALLSILLAFAGRGETVLSEALTWPGALAIAQALGIRLEGVATDEEGLIPDALEEACRRHAPRLLYTMPTLQNPTTATASLDRRRAIARIARAHGVLIVEDDAYGFLVAPRATPYLSIARDITIYVTSLSKPIAPAMRLGYVAAPALLRRRLVASFRATTVMASPILAELASRMIRNGEAARLARFQATAAERRQRLADAILGPSPIPVRASLHRWLRLPPGTSTAGFVADALSNDVAVTSGEVFSVLPGADPGGVRVCLCAEPDEARLEAALRVLAGLTTADHLGGLPVV